MRKPLQGIRQIIRFNWHFYFIAIVVIVGLLVVSIFLPLVFKYVAWLVIMMASGAMVTSVLVSMYVYDFTNLYSLDFLKKESNQRDLKILNIHAGFDETSSIIHNMLPQANLEVADFYNPLIHTEVSIKRARRSLPAYPGTLSIQTHSLPYEDESFQIIMLFLSAHEIRNNPERIRFFIELKRILHKDGKIILTEHLRDLPNFLAYQIGFLHFHSKKTWIDTIESAGLKILSADKLNPFMIQFNIGKNENTSH